MSYWIHCKTAHLSLRYTTTALSFLSWSRAGIALPFEYAAEGDWEPVSDTDLIWRLTSNTWRKETKFQQFNWSLRLIREHKVSWYIRSRFRKVQQGRTAFLLCLTSDWLKTKNQQTNKNQNQQIKQKHRQKKNKQRETNLNYYCNNSIRCPWGCVHRQWAKRDLGLSLSLIARNPISTNRGFTAYKLCTNLDLRKSRQEQLRSERRRRTGNISEKYFVQQMKQNISAHRLNHCKPCPAIGPKNSRLPLKQSAVHWKLIMVWSPAFSRAFSSLPVFNLSSHENTHSVPYLLAIVVILVSVFWYIFSL